MKISGRIPGGGLTGTLFFFAMGLSFLSNDFILGKLAGVLCILLGIVSLVGNTPIIGQVLGKVIVIIIGLLFALPGLFCLYLTFFTETLNKEDTIVALLLGIAFTVIGGYTTFIGAFKKV